REIPHSVLNAKHLEEEAAIVAEAGRRGAVTVATDMAGRGTDIVLGGNVDFLADKHLRERGLDPVETPDKYDAAWREVRSHVKAEAAMEADKVASLGGLYVVGTERHESRRIDNQLRGRSGRQGDPGETRFYLSLGDELMRRFTSPRLEKMLARLDLRDDMPIQANIVSRAIQGAQAQMEQQNFETRRDVLKYDEVMNQQRKVIYAERRRILEGEDLKIQVLQMIRDVISAHVDGATAEERTAGWDLDTLWLALNELYPVGVDQDSLKPIVRGRPKDDAFRKRLRASLIVDAKKAFAQREAEVEQIAGAGAMRKLEHSVILDVIDRKWREHLYEMDYLKQGIGLRAMARRDPLVEYQRAGYDMFVGMLEALKEECVHNLFHGPVRPEPAPVAVMPTELAESDVAATYFAEEVSAQGDGGRHAAPVDALATHGTAATGRHRGSTA
ncbi:MAG: preprotein translocase subunit SecA, partial [Reyranella sp.]